MKNLPFPCQVLFVANVDRVATFYREVASMRMIASDDFHVVLEIDGFQLVVHKLSGEPEPNRDADGSVIVRDDSYTKLCLPVESIEAARSQATSLGGSIKPAKFEWLARGFRACDGNDPEGNVIQVRESVAS